MQNITDRSMQASPSSTDRWLTQPFKRGAGTFVGRITPAGERLFYFRYTDSQGRRPFLPLGSYHPKGTGGGLTLADAFLKATELSKLYQSGVRDLREHFAQEAERSRLARRLFCRARGGAGRVEKTDLDDSTAAMGKPLGCVQPCRAERSNEVGVGESGKLRAL